MAWVQGFRRLKSSAFTAWLYAIAHIRGLRMKEPHVSSQLYCWNVLLNGILKTQQFCRDTYTEAKSALNLATALSRAFGDPGSNPTLRPGVLTEDKKRLAATKYCETSRSTTELRPRIYGAAGIRTRDLGVISSCSSTGIRRKKAVDSIQ
jgi:hypothetical protein